MRHLNQHHRLGVSLTSVALLSGLVAFALGWLVPVPLPNSPALPRAAVQTVLPPPQAVMVTVLPERLR